MDVEFLNPDGVFKPGHYSQLIKINQGTLLILSGQVAWDESGNLVGGSDLKLQATQVFENIKKILASVGADFSNVIRFGIFIVNYQPEDRVALSEVQNQYIDLSQPPASTLLGVQALARPDLKIEVEVTAVIA